MPTHEVLFVAGLARSGTTALQRVLDPHPDIALGLERYKRLWGSGIGSITAERFDRERFFDFAEDLTNITPDVEWAAPRIALLDRKWDSARYRGDKMTTIRAMRLWETIPEARFVFIVRDLAQVAYSWEQRASNEADSGWQRDTGALRSVAAWNTAVRRIRRAVVTRPEHAMVVDYERFFADPDAASLHAIAAFLDVDAAPMLPAFAEAHTTYVDSVAGRDRTLPPDLTSFIDENADRAAWRRVQALVP